MMFSPGYFPPGYFPPGYWPDTLPGQIDPQVFGSTRLSNDFSSKQTTEFTTAVSSPVGYTSKRVEY